MPAGLPNAPEVVPAAFGNQVANLAPSDANAQFSGTSFVPAQDFAMSLPGGQLVQFRNGVTHVTDADMRKRLDSLDAPTVGIAITNQAATQDVPFSYQFPAGAFADADVALYGVAALTYSATKVDGSALPSWLTFTPATRTFAGTPTSGDVGTLSLKVTATSQDGETATQTFDIVVS